MRCASNAFYSATRPIYCDNVDLSAVRDDGSARCDAISIVFDMDTMPAKLGEPIAAEPLKWPECEGMGCDGKPLAPRE